MEVILPAQCAWKLHMYSTNAMITTGMFQCFKNAQQSRNTESYTKNTMIANHPLKNLIHVLLSDSQWGLFTWQPLASLQSCITHSTYRLLVKPYICFVHTHAHILATHPKKWLKISKCCTLILCMASGPPLHKHSEYKPYVDSECSTRYTWLQKDVMIQCQVE